MTEMVERVTKAILPAFAHITDPEYRRTIAGCWARAAIEAMIEPTYPMLEAGRDRDRANEIETRRRYNEEGQLTYRTENIEKIWRVMVQKANEPTPKTPVTS